MAVPAAPGEVVSTWIGHRQRLRGWLEGLEEDDWDAPTRCSEWCVADLVRHLISGARFLGYTLHQAQKGQPSRLLEGFDPQTTPAQAASQLADVPTPDLLDALAEADGRIDAGVRGRTEADMRLPAEMPLGHVPSFVTLNHFLWDSWVHERDLMVPRQETPPTDPAEAVIAVSYALALAGAIGADMAERAITFDVHLVDVDRWVSVEHDPATTVVTTGRSSDRASVLAAPAGDLVDFTTGREAARPPEGDPDVLAFAGRLTTMLA